MKGRRTFYVADLHLGHRTMAGYEVADGVPGAPATVEERDELIVSGWNSTIGRNDDVWILGDIAYLPQGQFVGMLRRLNGHKRIVMGNHDRAWVRKLADTHRGDVVDVVDYARIGDRNRKVVLSHYPIAFWDQQHRGAYHLYGHVHLTEEERLFQEFGKGLVAAGRLPEFRAINVGIMATGYVPMDLDQLIERAGLGHRTREFDGIARHIREAEAGG